MNEKYITEVDKLSDDKILLTYSDDSTAEVPVIKLESRGKAIELCIEKTKQYFVDPEKAFENLNDLTNDFSRHRNYEIEDYLDWITETHGHRINELCPFNGFSWFS